MEDTGPATWTEADKNNWKKISELELSSVRMALLESIKNGNAKPLDDEEVLPPEKWVSVAEEAYRRFLFVCKKYPNRSIVPNAKIDLFWHNHILDTKKYMADCETIFGTFLHHVPDTGGIDATLLMTSFQDSQKLFKNEFSLPIDGKVQHCTNGGGPTAPKCQAICRGECYRPNK